MPAAICVSRCHS